MTELSIRRGPGRPPRSPPPATDVSHETVPEIDVRRFSLADTATVGPWLISRLHAQYAHLSEGTLAGLMRSWISANDMNFAIAGEGGAAVGLAIVGREPLRALGTVSEIFVFMRETGQSTYSERAAAAIYRHWKRWGRGFHADEMRVGICCDMTPGRLRELVGGEARTRIFVDLHRGA